MHIARVTPSRHCLSKGAERSYRLRVRQYRPRSHRRRGSGANSECEHVHQPVHVRVRIEWVAFPGRMGLNAVG
jgi:hypothetical protein